MKSFLMIFLALGFSSCIYDPPAGSVLRYRNGDIIRVTRTDGSYENSVKGKGP
jgi:hypothetical protein